MNTFKMKASPDNVNTFQKNMDRERQKVKGSIISDFRINQRPKGDPSLKTCGRGAGWSRWQSKLFSSNSPRQILPWNVTIHAHYHYQKVKLCESHNCLQTKLRVECTIKCLCAFNSIVPAI